MKSLKVGYFGIIFLLLVLAALVLASVDIQYEEPKIKIIIGVDDKNLMHDEVEKLKQYLNEMGIANIETYYTSDNIDWKYFKDSDLIIYHNMGWDWYDYKNGKSPQIYAILKKAKDCGIPILVLGDDLTWHADNYYASEVLHLHSAESNGRLGSYNMVQIVDVNSPIINGKFGKVQNFMYRGDPDVMCTHREGKILATTSCIGTCSETPILFYYIDKSPIIAINLDLYLYSCSSKKMGIVGQEHDLKMIELLFKNSVDYLLNWANYNFQSPYQHRPNPPSVPEERNPILPCNVALDAKVTLHGGSFFTDGWGGGKIVDKHTIVDGVFLPRGKQWDQDAVWWDCHDGVNRYIKIDLGGVYEIYGFIVQADDNDAYNLYY